MRDLGLVQGNNHGQKSDAETSQESACHQVRDLGGSSLQGSSNNEDDAANGDCPSSARVLGCGASKHGAKEGAGGEQGDHGTAVTVLEACPSNAKGSRMTYVAESVEVVLKRS